MVDRYAKYEALSELAIAEKIAGELELAQLLEAVARSVLLERERQAAAALRRACEGGERS